VYDYSVYDRYERSLNDERNAVLVVDTDSNFLNLDSWCSYINEKFNVTDSQEFKSSIINIMIYILGKYIQIALNRLTDNCNLSIEKQPIINMKSEFFYKRIMLTSNKKQYVGLNTITEGNILPKPKVDMKGLSIKKVNVNLRSREYFKKIIEEDILKSEKIDLSKILSLFNDYENEIRTSLMNGELTFSTPSKINEIQSYKMPYSIGSVRGAIVYNQLFPDAPIVPPSKVNTVKLKGFTLEDLKPIYNTSEYDIIKEIIFDSKELELSKHGFKIISIPKNIVKLPEWIIPLIDVEEIVSDNVRTGIIVLESLGIKIMTLLKNKDYYSNIIDF
jgi:hypothetical protein